ncbi:hypothetical protein ACA910_009595 [Epithemia clementina (nom. ined.)]
MNEDMVNLAGTKRSAPSDSVRPSNSETTTPTLAPGLSDFVGTVPLPPPIGPACPQPLTAPGPRPTTPPLPAPSPTPASIAGPAPDNTHTPLTTPIQATTLDISDAKSYAAFSSDDPSQSSSRPRSNSRSKRRARLRKSKRHSRSSTSRSLPTSSLPANSGPQPQPRSPTIPQQTQMVDPGPHHSQPTASSPSLMPRALRGTRSILPAAPPATTAAPSASPLPPKTSLTTPRSYRATIPHALCHPRQLYHAQLLVPATAATLVPTPASRVPTPNPSHFSRWDVKLTLPPSEDPLTELHLACTAIFTEIKKIDHNARLYPWDEAVAFGGRSTCKPSIVDPT